MRVLVTGGSGFIGTNTIEALVARGDEPVNFDVVPPVNRAHDSYFRPVDLRDREGLIRATSQLRPDAVLHLGARTDFGGESVTADYAANITGVSNLIEAIDASGTVSRVVFASSRMVHATGYVPVHDEDWCPPNAYGESKVIGEQLVRRYGPSDAVWTIVRPTSVWGPWMRDPNDQFFRMIKRGLYIHAKGVNPPKQYSYVENGVAQLIAIVEAPPAVVHRKVFYLADYVPLRLQEWANLIARELGAPPIKVLPASILRVAARAGDLVAPAWGGVPLTSFRWKNMAAPIEFDMAPLKGIAPNLPVDVSQAVSRTIAWMREHGQL